MRRVAKGHFRNELRWRLFSSLGIASVFILLPPYARPQEARNDLPAFEVVSVKANHSGDPYFKISPRQPNIAKFSATNVTVQRLLTVAYGVEASMISGGPRWIESATFDIDAKGGKTPSLNDLLLMLQGLLADRFKLSTHWAPTEMSVYYLTAGKGGSKLHPSVCASSADGKAKDCGGFHFTPSGIRAIGAPVRDLVRALTDMTGRPVLDRTGLEGKFDFDFTFRLTVSPRGGGEQIMEERLDLPSSSIFNALPEQLGLKLQAGKASVSRLIVDYLEMPSGN